MAMDTNLMMQMLSGYSQSLSQGKPGILGVNPMTQQAGQAQGFAQYLQQILGGGGKMTMDKEKFGISGPTSILGEQGSNPVASGDPTSGGYGGTAQGVADRTAPQGQPIQGQGQNTLDPRMGMLMQMLMGSGGSNPQ